MTLLFEPLDPTKVKPLSHTKQLPIGSYSGCIVSSMIKDAQSGNGNQYIELTIKCLDADFEGFLVRDIVNLKNINPKTVELGMARLSSYCHAVSMLDILEDTRQLFGLTFSFDVSQKKDSEYTEMTYIRPLETSAAQAPTGWPQAQAPTGWPQSQAPAQAPAGWPQAQAPAQAPAGEKIDTPAQLPTSLPWRQ
jgi:Protein of unknown function (DUF669)